MGRLSAVLIVGLWLACAPKRVEPEPAPVVARGAPIATKLQPPDGGPFDFVPLPEEPKPRVTGDIDHPGELSGYR